jgi:hypothetical protein
LGYWQKHPKKDGEAVLREFHAHGWRITRGKLYYFCYCPKSCGQHTKTVRLTPSGPYYFNNVIRVVQKLSCW